MKKILLFAVFILSCFTSFANVAMPGFWDTGTGRKFVHFFKEDAAHAGKISMKKEQITVALYKDFAVVKGVYTMFNASQDTIFIRTGFPVSGTADNPNTPSVLFNDLFALTAKVNGTSVPVVRLPDYLQANPQFGYNAALPADSVYEGVFSDPDNWYVWENIYPPGETEVTVYYITDNSNGLIRKGYSTEKANGFSYIIESGASWQAPIGSGTVTVHMMEGLTADDLQAVAPADKFIFNGKNILQRVFTELHAKPQDNLLIRYTASEPGFLIENIIKDSSAYYAVTDSLQSTFAVITSSGITPSGTFEPTSSLFTTVTKTFLYLAGALVLYFGFRYFTKK